MYENTKTFKMMINVYINYKHIINKKTPTKHTKQ